jgi:hypothetical protein
VGRDPAEIERSVLISAGDVQALDTFRDAGATHIIYGMGEPWDFSAVEELVRWRDRQ